MTKMICRDYKSGCIGECIRDGSCVTFPYVLFGKKERILPAVTGGEKMVPGFTIRGYTGSCVEQYALEKGMEKKESMW